MLDACWLEVYLKFIKHPMMIMRQCNSIQWAVNLRAVNKMNNVGVEHVQNPEYILLRVALQHGISIAEDKGCIPVDILDQCPEMQLLLDSAVKYGQLPGTGNRRFVHSSIDFRHRP